MLLHVTILHVDVLVVSFPPSCIVVHKVGLNYKLTQKDLD